MKPLAFVAQAAKAFYAALVAFLGAVATVLVGDASLGDLSDGQWITTALAALIAFGGVYRLPSRT